jgi:hypothetical protein
MNDVRTSKPNLGELVKIPNRFVFIRNGHAFKITLIPDSLKIAAYQKQIDFVAVSVFELANMTVNIRQLAVAAALDSNLFPSSKSTWSREL